MHMAGKKQQKLLKYPEKNNVRKTASRRWNVNGGGALRASNIHSDKCSWSEHATARSDNGMGIIRQEYVIAAERVTERPANDQRQASASEGGQQMAPGRTGPAPHAHSWQTGSVEDICLGFTGYPPKPHIDKTFILRFLVQFNEKLLFKYEETTLRAEIIEISQFESKVGVTALCWDKHLPPVWGLSRTSGVGFWACP